jgi:hypothetical protein
MSERKAVTKVSCPSCKGTGLFLSMDVPCLWCKGTKKLVASGAKRYADQTYMLAGGGYIDGSHDLADMRRMEAEAEGIYHAVGADPPWAKHKRKLMNSRC